MNTLKQTLLILAKHPETDFRRNALWRMLLPLIRGPRVLDVGCGMGFMTRKMAARGHRVVAIDTDYDFVASAIRDERSGNCVAAGVTYADGLFPFADASFDTVVSLDVIEHVDDDAALLREFARLLSSGGRLILTVPALPVLFGQRDVAMGHVRRYTKALLRQRLAQAELETYRLVYWNALGVTPYLLAERVLRRPVPDTIRQGQPVWNRLLLASLIKRWLLVEWRIARALPLGLSLIVVALRREANRNP